ncbi:hypothetical protein D3C85_1418520 [compost metagenome]
MVIDHIATQGEHHAVDVLRTEAVEHQWLVQRHDVGHQISFATDGCFGCLDAEHRRHQQQQIKHRRSVRFSGHVHGPRGGCSKG